MEACKRGTQKQKQRVEEQQLGLTVVLLPLNFYSFTFPLKKKVTSASIPKQELYAPPYHPR